MHDNNRTISAQAGAASAQLHVQEGLQLDCAASHGLARHENVLLTFYVAFLARSL